MAPLHPVYMRQPHLAESRTVCKRAPTYVGTTDPAENCGMRGSRVAMGYQRHLYHQTMNTTMTGGQAVVATLAVNGVDTIFGIPGVHTLPIYEAIRQSHIRHVVARHEQGAGFMAEGYARATGRI